MTHHNKLDIEQLTDQSGLGSAEKWTGASPRRAALFFPLDVFLQLPVRLELLLALLVQIIGRHLALRSDR